MKRTGKISQLVRFYRANQHYRFVILLASLILLFVAVAAVSLVQRQSYRHLAGISIALLFDLMLLSAVNAVCQTRKTMTAAVLLAVPAALFGLLSAASDTEPALAAISNLLAVAFITFVIVLVLDFMFRSPRVDANMICASLCIYLLIGVAWASLYTLCDIVPGSFGQTSMVFGGEKSLTPIYFSFVTLTTLGYGDVVPVSPPAKILAVLEAVIGQIYLTVLVARLVGLHIAYVTSPETEDPS